MGGTRRSRSRLGIGISTNGLPSPIAIRRSLTPSPSAVGHEEGAAVACGVRGRHDGGCLVGQEERTAVAVMCGSGKGPNHCERE
jgi:hypothetical protein